MKPCHFILQRFIETELSLYHTERWYGQTKGEAAKPSCQRNRYEVKQKQRTLVAGQIIDVSDEPSENKTGNRQGAAGKSKVTKIPEDLL
jgi:hypothetical protein